MTKRKVGMAVFAMLLCVCMTIFVACGPQGERGEKGEQGEAGKDGVGIASVEKINSEGLTDTYKITYSDGSSTTFTVTNGKDGADGEDGTNGENGISITDAELNQSGELVLVFSDSSKITVGTVVGADGTTPHIGSNVNWFICEEDTGIPAQGKNGQDGAAGQDGADGADGKDGISVTGARIEDGILYLTFTDGNDSYETEVGQVGGADGADGQDGADGTDGKSAYELYKEYHPYYEGDEEQWLIDLANGALAESSFVFEPTAGGTAYILAEYRGREKEVAIPAEYDGKPVVQIGNHAFAQNIRTEKVVLPDNIAKICDHAFESCVNLQQIELPDNLVSIGAMAFYGCYSLRMVVIPQNVLFIGKDAFDYCYDLSLFAYAAEKPKGWDSYINSHRMHWNYAGRSGILENGIEWAEFWKDGEKRISVVGFPQDIDFIEIPEMIEGSPVKEIETDFLNYYTTPVAVVLPDSLENVDYSNDIVLFLSRKQSGTNNNVYYGFGGECGLTDDAYFWMKKADGTASLLRYYGISSAEIPATVNGCTVTEIGHRFANGSGSLKNLAIPSSVQTIGVDAFRDCSNLESVALAENSSLQTIGDGAFSGCTALRSVTFNGCETLETIGRDAFNGCTKLTSAEIPASVRNIGCSAFASCGLQNITFGANSALESIGEAAFYGNPASSIVLPAGIVSIDVAAFAACQNLQYVFFEGESAPAQIGNGAFEGPAMFYYFSDNGTEEPDTHWHYVNGEPSLWIWGDAKTYIFESNGGTAYDPIETAALLALPTPVKDGYWFVGWFDNPECTGSPIALPYFSAEKTTLYAKWVEVSAGQSKGLEIENGKIVGLGTCTDTVLHIYLPIADGAFGSIADCSYISAVYLYDGCSYIGANAFSGCRSLDSVYFHQTSVPQIGDDAFSGTWDSTAFSVYVPQELYGGYAALESGGWREYIVDAGKLHSMEEPGN